MDLVWHYTTRSCGRHILDSGELKPADSYMECGEKPILWFSRNQYWEETANKAFVPHGAKVSRRLTMKQMHEFDGGLCRFGISIERLLPWPEIAVAAGMRKGIQKGLEKAGREYRANPRDWLGSLEKVSIWNNNVFMQTMSDDWEWGLQNAVSGNWEQGRYGQL